MHQSSRPLIPSFLNFSFRHNLFYFEIEDLKRLMFFLTCLHLSPSIPDARVWSLSYSSLFTVKSFYLALSNHANPAPLFCTNFVWKSQVSFKVKSFACLVAHKNVNTNDMLQLRRSYKALDLMFVGCVWRIVKW